MQNASYSKDKQNGVAFEAASVTDTQDEHNKANMSVM